AGSGRTGTQPVFADIAARAPAVGNDVVGNGGVAGVAAAAGGPAAASAGFDGVPGSSTGGAAGACRLAISARASRRPAARVSSASRAGAPNPSIRATGSYGTRSTAATRPRT